MNKITKKEQAHTSADCDCAHVRARLSTDALISLPYAFSSSLISATTRSAPARARLGTSQPDPPVRFPPGSRPSADTRTPPYGPYPTHHSAWQLLRSARASHTGRRTCTWLPSRPVTLRWLQNAPSRT